MAVYLNKKWGVPINILNKPGGNTIPACLEVHNATPDGYTILGDGTGSTSQLAVVGKNLPFKIMDRTFIASFFTAPNVLIVYGQSPFKTVEDLVAWAKENPEKISYASIGGTTGNELTMRQFFKAIGVDVKKTKPVMVRGGSEIVILVSGGHAMMGSASTTATLPSVKGGTVRPLFITSKTRSPLLPDLRTAEEAGYPTLTTTNWVGVSGPMELSSLIVDKWSEGLREMLNVPEVISQMKNIGGVPFYLDPQAVKEYIIKDTQSAREYFQ